MELDLSEVPCTKCQLPGGLRIEMRTEVEAKPLGSYSLAGEQVKVSAHVSDRPWMVCDLCNAECKGKRDTDERGNE